MLKLLLLLFKGAKLGKLALTGGTMLLSVIAYAWIFGWWYAVGFVGLIFVHEMGHYLAARQRGLDVGAPTFIPFVGAWIELKQRPHDAETEAWIGLAGPLVGSLGALACYFAARASGSQLLLALAYAGFFINLFNLIPVSPFDGGRVSAVLSPRLWLLGAPILVALFFWRPSPLLIFMAILAAPQVMQAIRGFRSPEQQAYYAASAETRLGYGLAYLGLAAFLAIMSYELHQQLPRLH
ncbi:site-2 protease family protein [Dokdonella fugitiva]|jgi:Zn-dependent protease|uniref:Zn-dependent protease n=1 Tax=Dokdonella fugitiva TaxID=328517 RepID=A0A4R2HY25_9GAMM|nr:site-2 protease family protein [Dokdonella fugitiva]MBA8883087.1 Zn-dependent protease [Dokdonella fugitiva]TCO36523.1 Zn-dependent protease [Dokdonella fugitiva]